MYYSVSTSTDVSGKTFTLSEFTFSSSTPLTVVLLVVASKPFTGSAMLETKPRLHCRYAAVTPLVLIPATHSVIVRSF